MTTRRLTTLLLVAGLLAGCSSTPDPAPAAPPSPRQSQTPTAPAPAGDDLEDPAQQTSASPRGDQAPVVLSGPVTAIVDGDTIDLGEERIRLAIVDTPEVYGGLETCGPEASTFTATFLEGQTVAVYRPEGAPERDGFGRLVGEVVRVSDGASLNVRLVAAGLAAIDERFTDEDADLAQRLEAAADVAADPGCVPRGEDAEASSDEDVPAGTSPVRIDSVVHDPDGDDLAAGSSEHVVLRNDDVVDLPLVGWSLVDLAGNRIDFPEGVVVPAGSTLRVHSGPGDDSAQAWYADLSGAWLNNDGDEVVLFDPSGTPVSSHRW